MYEKTAKWMDTAVSSALLCDLKKNPKHQHRTTCASICYECNATFEMNGDQK